MTTMEEPTTTTTEEPATTTAEWDDDLTPDGLPRALLAGLQRPDTFQHAVDNLPNDTSAQILKMWGIMHGHYLPADKRKGERTQPKRYEIQPVGIPDTAEVTLNVDDAYHVFSTLLDAIKVWDYSTDPLDDYAARERLGDLLDAVKIMNAGYMAAILPGVQAHRDDEAAARAWTADRWMKRGELARTRRAASSAAEGADA